MRKVWKSKITKISDFINEHIFGEEDKKEEKEKIVPLISREFIESIIGKKKKDKE
jgi:hypothetical protein